jgi:lipopolysaccharide export system permease protein
MRILDRYIGGKFLAAAIFSVVAFVAIFLVVDIVERLDTFIDKDVPFFTVVQYYLFYVPYIVILTLPIAMLLASLFSISALSRHQELTAMKAAGISLYRMLLPVFSLGLLVSILCMIFGEFVVPYTNERKGTIWSREIKKRSQQKGALRRDIYLQGSDGRIYFLREYDGQTQTGKGILLQRYQNGHLVSRIDAGQMAWVNGAWIFRDGLSRSFVGEEEIATEFAELRRPDLEETPQDFSKKQKQPDEMNYRELRQYIRRVEHSGGEVQREQVDLFLKIAFPFANLIIVLFGAPLASNPRRSGAAVSFGISLFICFVYYSFLRLGQALGYNGTLPPALSAWMGNAVFGMAGLFVLWKAKK